MSWVRRRNVYATLIVLGVVWLLVVLLFDPLLRWGLIHAGEAAAGAKVEIGSLKTKFSRGSLTIRAVAVANKNEPMKNVLEFEDAELSFLPGAALRGKIVIPTAALRGLQFGTPRKTSGALPLKKPSALGRLVEKQLAPASQRLDADLGKAKHAAAEVDPRKLEGLKGLDAAQQQLGKAGDQLKGKLGVDAVDAQIKDLEGQIKQLQSGGNSPADIAKKAQLAADAQKKIKALLSQVDQSRAAVNQQFAGVQAKLKQADDLRHKDVNGLLAAAGLPTLDAESLTRHLLGAQTAKKISTALEWASWIRQRSASQTDKAKQKPPQRRRGVNFEFPRAHTYPAFLLEKADITGRVAQLFEGKDMALQGLLTGVTSNPPLYGQPARLTLAGAVKGGPTMDLKAMVDQVRAPGATEVNLHYKGLPLAGLALGDDQLGAALKGGVGDLNGTIRIAGEQWSGTVLLQADKVSLAPQVKLAGPAAGYASAALAGISRFNVTIGISGKEGDLHLKLSSDLGQTLASGMKKAFSGEVDKQRKEVEAKVDALYAQRRQQLQGQADSTQKQLLAPLERQQSQLNEQLKRAISKGLGKGLPKGLKLPF